MNTQAILDVLNQATKLTLEEQRQLNSLLCDNMKGLAKLEGMTKSFEYGIGDTVTFDARTKGIIKMKVTGFSRDRSKLKGTQIGGVRPGCEWTVGLTIPSLRKI